MTIIAGIDLETTGLLFDKNHITEIGWIIKDSESPKNLFAASILIKPGFPKDALTQEIIDLTGITYDMLERFGRPFAEACAFLLESLTAHGVEYMVAHNAPFDRTFLEYHMKQEMSLPPRLNLPWLDTRSDINYASKIKGRSLTHVAAELGFLNPFPHAALFDVATMLRVLSNYSIADVIARSKEPTLIIKAVVSYDNRELAKKCRFMWEKIDDKKSYPKTWVKRVKASDLDKERTDANFEIVILEEERKDVC